MTAIAVTCCDGRDSADVRYPPICRHGRKAILSTGRYADRALWAGPADPGGARPMTDDAVRYVRSGDGQVEYRGVGSGPSVAWVPGTIAGAPPRS